MGLWIFSSNSGFVVSDSSFYPGPAFCQYSKGITDGPGATGNKQGSQNKDFAPIQSYFKALE